MPSLFAPDRFTEPTSYKKDDVSGRYAYKKPKSSVKASWYPGLKFGGNQSGYSSVIPNPSWYGPDYADCISVRARVRRARRAARGARPRVRRASARALTRAPPHPRRAR